MLAIAAAVCFAIAFAFHGGAVSVHTHWLDVTGLTLLGLVFLAAHFAKR